MHDRRRRLAECQEGIQDGLQLVYGGDMDLHKKAILARDAVAFDHLRGPLRQLGAIGANRFAAAWADVAALTVDQLVAYARQADPASSQPQASADPLSQREREVIALLARGYTNRQIAEELIISGRTADAHVAHILAKLGLSTRAQAAVWAVEHPLARTDLAQPAHNAR